MVLRIALYTFLFNLDNDRKCQGNLSVYVKSPACRGYAIAMESEKKCQNYQKFYHLYEYIRPNYEQIRENYL